MSDNLPRWRRALVVVAHPDDESFGLGALVSTFTQASAEVDVLCFTQGEASTLGASDDLAGIRAGELERAAQALGVRRALLRNHPDGGLADVRHDILDSDVLATARELGADGLLAIDWTGVTRHPDHIAATAAAARVGEAEGLPVLGWGLPEAVAQQLRTETGAPFAGLAPEEVELTVEVDRTAQHAAIVCHATQATPDSVLWRRLELQGSTETLRWLHRVD